MLLDSLEEFTLEKENFNLEKLSRILKNIDTLWNTHEKEEEEFFKGINKWGVKFSNEKMLIEDHKQLRGHWKVIQDSLKNEDKQNIFITLDTDGKMLIEKFRDHINQEEKALEKWLKFNPSSQF